MILNPVWPLQLNKKIFSSVTLLLSTFQSLREILITDKAMKKVQDIHKIKIPFYSALNFRLYLFLRA